ncbi:MAG: proteophosphoglycan precursor [Rhodobacterales bacterium]|nr:MAG: proteophosphoglycan precursor [Rhodobacterales bacterium]
MTKPRAGKNPAPSAEGLAAAARQAARKRRAPGPAPVHLWDPPFCGDLDIRIARDGTWFYLGTPIGRVELVKLFASILKREDDEYFLVTPVEKVRIRVDDAPFVAVDFSVQGAGRAQEVRFETGLGEHATAGPTHPLRVARDPESGEPAPYVEIRTGLEALIDRKSFFRLVDLCAHEDHAGARWFGLWSGGRFFPVIPSADLPG